MNRWVKRGIAATMAAVLTVGLWGCGNQGTDPKIKQAAKENVYKYEEVELFETSKDGESMIDYNIFSMSCVDQRIMLLANVYEYTEDAMRDELQLISMNMDGSDRQEVVLFNRADMAQQDMDKNYYVSNLCMTENYVFGVGETNDYSQVDSYGNPQREVELVCWDMSGKELWRQSLLPKDLPEGEWFYVDRISNIGQDQILVCVREEYFIYDAKGDIVGKPKLDMENGINELFFGRDGKAFVTMWDANWTKLSMAPFDLKTGQIGEPVEPPFNMNYYGVNSSVNYDLLLTSSTGVFGYNVGDAEPTPIMNYINSDLPASGLNQITEISETQFLASYYDNTDYQQHIGLFTYVDPADIPDKEVITIASYYMDYQMRRRVIEYNKTNEKYRIMIKDYSQYSQADDYMAGYTKLNNDILAGNMPDILIVDGEIPLDSYIEKGLIADIYKFLDEDEELNREDYFQNVLDAYTVDGKLYNIVPYFDVWTVLGKSEDVGEEPGWTVQEMLDLLASKPEGTSLFGSEMNRNTLMYYASMMAIPEFIDEETGKCSFDSQGFKDLLEFLKTLPEELPEQDWEDPDYWIENQMQYIEGRTLLMTSTITSAQSLIYTFGNFGTSEVTYIGFPSENGKGAVLNCYDRYAISAKTPNREGVWEFMRYYYTDEFQESVHQMPINKEIWMEKASAAMEKPYWEDENGEKHYEEYTTWIGEKEVILEPFTQEQVDDLFDYVSSVTTVYNYDQSLIDIIEEEAAPFFAGQKNVDEVVNIIQNKIQLYLDENM